MKPGMSLIKHYLQFKDLRAQEYDYVFERTAIIKQRFKNYEKYQPLADRTLAMIFEKASTRTRVSFEAGMYQMGGSVVHLTTGDSQLGRSEPVEDSAKVISRMVDIVMIRTYEQAKLVRFAANSRVPRASRKKPTSRRRASSPRPATTSCSHSTPRAFTSPAWSNARTAARTHASSTISTTHSKPSRRFSAPSSTSPASTPAR